MQDLLCSDMWLISQCLKHTYRKTWKSATDGLVSMAIDILERASLILPTRCNWMAYQRKAS